MSVLNLLHDMATTKPSENDNRGADSTGPKTWRDKAKAILDAIRKTKPKKVEVE